MNLVSLVNPITLSARRARAVQAELHNDVAVPKALQVSVKGRVLTLEGTVGNHYQKRCAEQIVSSSQPQLTLHSKLRVQAPPVTVSILRRRLHQRVRALPFDTSGLSLELSGANVLVTGRLATWAERAEVERCVLATPGVTTVDTQVELDSAVPGA